MISPELYERAFRAVQAVSEPARRARLHQKLDHYLSRNGVGVFWEIGADGKYHATKIVRRSK